MKITPKNSKSPQDHNKNLYTKVKDLPIIKDILNLNYLYFFQNVYSFRMYITKAREI